MREFSSRLLLALFLVINLPSAFLIPSLRGLAPTELSGEVKIGALLSMTGDLAPFGENELVAAQFAAVEVNNFLSGVGADWFLTIEPEDTQIKPDIALEKVESLAARGIKLIIGPLSSGEVRSIKGYCDANKILAISQSSTAPDMAIEDDYIFRFCPSDQYGQGPAIGRLMYDDGKRYIIPVTRNDAWGVGLEEATKKKFMDELGGTFLTGIRYDPEATSFTTEAADLAWRVSNAVAWYGADSVAVLHISFEEVNTFMTSAMDYAILDDVKWFGSDGTAGSGAMLGDANVRDFALSVEYPSTIFAPTESEKWERVRQNGIVVLGREPESFSYNVYDIVWVYALALLETGAYDAEAVKAVLPTVASNYFGASGWIELDDAGDRMAADYDIYQISEILSSEYDWQVVGTYSSATDSVVWRPMTPRPLYVFEPIWGDGIFYVVTDSNSTVSDFYFNPNEGSFIRFNVSGSDSTSGFCEVAIQKQFMWAEINDWTVLVQGNSVDVAVLQEDGFFTHLYFTFDLSSKTVTIIATGIIPEFPTLIFLPLFTTATLLVAVAYRRKRMHAFELVGRLATATHTETQTTILEVSVFFYA